MKIFYVSASTILSSLITIFLPIYLNDKYTAKRDLKYFCEKITSFIQKTINNEKYYIITNSLAINDLFIMQHTVSNKIKLLKTFEKKFNISVELEFIEEELLEYKEILENHIFQIGALNQLSHELRKPLTLMDSKLDEIKIKLYK